MNKKKVNVVSIEDRIPKLKQVRKKKANRRLVFYLSIFFILISIIVYLQSSLSNVKEINVLGNEYVIDEEIIKQSELTDQTNVWSVDRKKIEKMLKKNEVIQSAKVKRILPSTIEIKVKEYIHVGYVQDDQGTYATFGNGTKLPTRLKTLGNAPLIMGFSDDESLDKMIKQLAEVPKNILNLISEIHWMPTEENKNKIMLYMNDGFIVDGTIRNFAEKIQIYPSIASQLEPDSQGIIHIGVGAYFEDFNAETKNEEIEHETEG